MAKNFRIEPGIWDTAKARADSEGTTLTAVIVTALEAYAAGAPAPIARPAPATRPPTARASGDGCRHPRTRVLKGLCRSCGRFVG